jgi:hypothetical protein
MNTFLSIFADLITVFHGILFGYMVTTPFFMLWAIFKHPTLKIKEIAPWVFLSSAMLINYVSKTECQITTVENGMKEMSKCEYHGNTFMEHQMTQAGFKIDTFSMFAVLSTIIFGTLAIRKAIKKLNG